MALKILVIEIVCLNLWSTSYSLLSPLSLFFLFFLLFNCKKKFLKKLNEKLAATCGRPDLSRWPSSHPMAFYHDFSTLYRHFLSRLFRLTGSRSSRAATDIRYLQDHSYSRLNIWPVAWGNMEHLKDSWFQKNFTVQIDQFKWEILIYRYFLNKWFKLSKISFLSNFFQPDLGDGSPCSPGPTYWSLMTARELGEDVWLEAASVPLCLTAHREMARTMSGKCNINNAWQKLHKQCLANKSQTMPGK